MRWISLFPTAKTAALYLVPIKSYSKNTQGSSILKCILVKMRVIKDILMIIFNKYDVKHV